MSQRHQQFGFIQHLIADPDDEAARLVYADWLEDNGDPLAELVRVQVEIARGDEGRIPRERELLDHLGFGRAGRSGREGTDDDEPGKDWNHGVQNGLVTLYLHQTPPVVPEGWAERFGWYAIRYKWAGEFVSGFKLTAKGLHALLDSPVMTGCYALDLSSLALTSKAVRLLAKSPAVAHLLRLDLRNNKLDADAVVALLESPHLQGLVELELSQNKLGEAGLLALARADGLPHLRRLRLWEVAETPQGFAALFRSAGYPELRCLDLSSNKLDLKAVQALAATTTYPQLTTLDLSETGMGDRRAVALARATGLPRLASLDLSGNKKLSDEGAIAVIGAKNLPALRSLDLSGCAIGVRTVEALCSAGHLLLAGSLNLGSCGLDDAAVAILAGTKAASSLKHLDLSRNRDITDAGARALAASPHLQGLESLRVYMCQIGPAGAAALTGAGVFPRLRKLDLEYNPVGDGGLLSLACWCHERGVRELDLDDAGITSAGVYELVASGYLVGLVRLGIGGNEDIGDAGIAALADCPDLGDLRDLDIYAVGLTEDGAEALIESDYLARELEVCLFDQEFGEEIEEALHARFAKVWV